jgi:hypothetical protein
MPSAIEETDPVDWVDRPKGASLSIQTLHQQNGFSLTLLCVYFPSFLPSWFCCVSVESTFETDCSPDLRANVQRRLTPRPGSRR